MKRKRQTQKILVVDDNTTNLGVISEYLEGCGFEVMTTRDGEDGIQVAHMGEPDLILLDVMMPGIDGFETCRRLQADEATKDIPVIFMTALTEVDYKVKGFAVGGVDYITKPLQEEEVVARVRMHLQLRAQQQKLEQQAFELKQARDMAETARQAAERANQAKSIFLANMSHELRTPLTAIIGFSQILDHTLTLSPEDQDNLNIILRSGEHLLTLINQVLDLSKIEAGRITLDETYFDLYRVLRELEDMFRLRTKHKGVQLHFECAAAVPQYIRTDPVKLRQVLINLLNNAAKFTKEGRISLIVRELNELNELKTQKLKNSKTHKTYKTLHFEVEDTGPGIAASDMNKLFEAFSQTETGRQMQGGTGLGLPISRKFVHLMGGDITVKSEVGRGSHFIFEILVGIAAESEIKRSRPARRAIAIEPGQSQYRLLIADEKSVNRKLFTTLLSPFGFELREATDGQETFEIWAEWKPHLIWMDIRMPVMEGLEVTKKIRNEELRVRNSKIPHSQFPVPNCKIIAVTAGSFEEERTKALSNGCDDFLRKPFREQEIVDLLQKHLSIRFVYAEKTQSAIDNRQSAIKTVLASEALATLPKEWHNELRYAAEVLDINLMNHTIEKIRRHDVLLAEALADLVRNYRFDLLQQYFED